MKLWHLYPNPDRPGLKSGVAVFDPWGSNSRDHVTGFVVRAEDEQSARLLVTTEKEKYLGSEILLTGDEDLRWDGKNYIPRESSVWLDPSMTTCEELAVDGEAKIILIQHGEMD